MNLKCSLIPFFLVFVLPFYPDAQNTAVDTNLYKIAFYNVENLFDPENDPLTNDDAYTPEGLNRWTYSRFYKKINNIAKVLIAIGDEAPPDIIGLAEIENLNVLKKLCYNSPLKKYGYKIIHYDSPDARGVDVGMLYNPYKIKILHSEPIGIVFPFDTNSRNRDILYVVSRFSNGDSVHLFINHWTSRFGGYAPTVPKRNYYAFVVRKKVEEILLGDPLANIVIMGDFNDYATDESIREILSAREYTSENDTARLFNLMYQFLKMHNIGTHKHEDFWGCLDQIIVSKSFMEDANNITLKNKEAFIFKEKFMIEPDEKYGGDKVFRTFLGPKYIGGYSDHLPVYIELKIKEDVESR